MKYSCTCFQINVIHMETIMVDFNPARYIIYNPTTQKEEPQFKKLKDIPEQHRGNFKEAPKHGFVYKEALENIDLAYLMALQQKMYMPKNGSKPSKRTQKIIDHQLGLLEETYHYAEISASKNK